MVTTAFDLVLFLNRPPSGLKSSAASFLWDTPLTPPPLRTLEEVVSWLSWRPHVGAETQELTLILYIFVIAAKTPDSVIFPPLKNNIT